MPGNYKKQIQIYEQSLDALRKANAHLYIDSLSPAEVVQANVGEEVLERLHDKLVGSVYVSQFLPPELTAGDRVETQFYFPKILDQGLEINTSPDITSYQANVSGFRAYNDLKADTLNVFDPSALIQGVTGVSKFERMLQDYYFLLSNIFQSVTTRGFTTWEIFDYIYIYLHKLHAEANKDQKQEVELLAAGLPNLFAVFHKPYDKEYRQYRDNIEELLYSGLNGILYNPRSPSRERYGAPYSDVAAGDPGSVNSALYNTKDFLNFGEVSTQLDSSFSLKDSVNSNPQNPKRDKNPSISAILIKDKSLRSGTKNSIELSAFFNLISNIEFSRAYPYFNATFILPSVSKQDKQAVFKTSTINQFMFGSRNQSETTAMYQSHEAKIEERYTDGTKKIGVETNAAIYAIPQSILNMNEKAGHRDTYNSDDKKIRLTSIHNKTSPFLTLKSFDLNIAPTKGLMCFKSGQLSLVLHDRTRMVDIAPFIKPDLFGSFGAEIAIEYGWVHPDAGKKNKSEMSINPIGDFLGSSRCIEKYMITNSQFSIKPSGEVEITLSVAMKGPIDIRQTEIVEFSENVITESNISILSISYNNLVRSLSSSISDKANQQKPFSFTAFESGISNIFKSKYIDFEDKKNKQIKNEIEKFQKDVKVISKILASAYVKESDLSDTKATIGFGSTTYKKWKEILSTATGIRNGWGKDSSSKGIMLEVTLAGDKTALDVVKDLRSIGTTLNNVSATFTLAFKLNAKVKNNIDSYINSLIGGITLHDMFYDTNLDSTRADKNLTLSTLNVVNNKKKNKKQSSNRSAEYLTFGSLLMSLTGTHMLSKSKYDEIQFIFHNVNDRCGIASNLVSDSMLNIASLLIKRTYLEDFLRDLFVKKSRITLESLIMQIIQKFILTKDNPCFGLEDLFERTKFNSAVKPISDKKRKKIGSKNYNTASDRLNYFYYKEDTSVYDKEGVFIPPNIKLSFECLTSEFDLDRTILRVSVYDENDNPYQSLCNTYNDSVNEGSNTVKQLLKLEKEIKTTKFQLSQINDKKKKKKTETETEKSALLKKLQNKSDAAVRLYNSLTSKSDGIFVKGSDGFFRFREGKGFLDIKEKSRKLLPTINFAANNSTLISAGVATVNEGKLNTVYITRQDRNETEELESSVILDMPLRVLPSTANFETFGCPWINFGQFIFLDLETGTTIDNTYVVTSIKHSMSPGKFNTSVTLSYGDVYGKYEGLADSFTKLAKFLPEVKDDLAAAKAAKKAANELKIANERLAEETSNLVAPLPELKNRKNLKKKKQISKKIYKTYHPLFNKNKGQSGLIPLDLETLINNYNTYKGENILITGVYDALTNKETFKASYSTIALFYTLLFYLSIDIVYHPGNKIIRSSDIKKKSLTKGVFQNLYSQVQKIMLSEKKDIEQTGKLSSDTLKLRSKFAKSSKAYLEMHYYKVGFDIYQERKRRGFNEKQEKKLLLSNKVKKSSEVKVNNKMHNFLETYGYVPFGKQDEPIEYSIKYLLLSDPDFFNVKRLKNATYNHDLLSKLDVFNEETETFEIAIEVLGNVYFYTFRIPNRKIIKFREDTYNAIPYDKGLNEDSKSQLQFKSSFEIEMIDDIDEFFDLIPDGKYIMSDKFEVKKNIFRKDKIRNEFNLNELRDFSLLSGDQVSELSQQTNIGLSHQIYIRRLEKSLVELGPDEESTVLAFGDRFFRFHIETGFPYVMRENELGSLLNKMIKDRKFEYFLYLINNFNDGEDLTELYSKKIISKISSHDLDLKISPDINFYNIINEPMSEGRNFSNLLNLFTSCVIENELVDKSIFTETAWIHEDSKAARRRQDEVMSQPDPVLAFPPRS